MYSRTTGLLLFVLTYGVTAKPLKPWGLANKAVQKGWVSIDDKGMASWGVEVEPPEDMDKVDFDIDPSMKIWKKVQTEDSEKYPKAEDDLDDLQHPSTADLLKASLEKKMDPLPAAELLPQDGKNNKKAKVDRDDTDHPQFGPEEDLDEVYHGDEDLYKYLAPLAVRYDSEPVVHAVHSEPEQDEDPMYHADSGIQVNALRPQVETNIQGRRHMQPEEDMDDLYHKDVPEMILYHREVQPAAVDWPIPVQHTAPEEDLDHIYHE